MRPLSMGSLPINEWLAQGPGIRLQRIHVIAEDDYLSHNILKQKHDTLSAVQTGMMHFDFIGVYVYWTKWGT